MPVPWVDDHVAIQLVFLVRFPFVCLARTRGAHEVEDMKCVDIFLTFQHLLPT